MWGNRIGWFISGVLLLLIGLLMWALYQLGRPTPPTEAFEKNRSQYLAQLQLPIPPSQVVPMNDPSDASELYRKAIESYSKDKNFYEEYKGGSEEPDAFALVLKAGHCKTGHVLEYDLNEMANYQLTLECEPMVAISAIHLAMLKRAATLKNEKKYDDARRYTEALFALGAKMFDERLNFAEFSTGMGFLGDAVDLQQIALLQKDEARARELEKFNSEKLAWRKTHVAYIEKFTHVIDGDVLAEHIGDIYALARYGKDRMWRVEALLSLGRIRFNIGENGRAIDQKLAPIVLAEVARTATDPAVKNAANAALNLTDADYRIQR